MAVPNSLQKIVYFLLMVQSDGLVGVGEGPGSCSTQSLRGPGSFILSLHHLLGPYPPLL